MGRRCLLAVWLSAGMAGVVLTAAGCSAPSGSVSARQAAGARAGTVETLVELRIAAASRKRVSQQELETAVQAPTEPGA